LLKQRKPPEHDFIYQGNPESNEEKLALFKRRQQKKLLDPLPNVNDVANDA
jgi:hypothetical protein